MENQKEATLGTDKGLQGVDAEIKRHQDALEIVMEN